MTTGARRRGAGTLGARRGSGLPPRGRGCHATVARALAAAGNARALSAAHVGGARSIVHWYRDGGGDADYLRPDHHTLSVYLEGGTGVRERGNPAVRGSPGAICVLPANEESRWFNDARVGVLHVYFDGADLASLYGAAAPAALAPLHYGRDPLLHALGRALVDDVDWTADADRLVREQVVAAMLARLVGGRREGAGGTRRVGALSAARLERVEARLRDPDATACTLGDLAAEVGLGVRQFARAYRAATGTTPGRRLLALRIERAQALIRGGAALVDVAHETGFASQSHLTRRFREHLGITLARWRDAS